MNKKYIVRLTAEERAHLHQMLSAGKAAARKLLHARILLKADASPAVPGWTDEHISEALEVSTTTIGRVRQQFVEHSLTAALERCLPCGHHPRRLNGEAEAHLIALACSPAPAGTCIGPFAARRQTGRTGLCRTRQSETVRQVLKKTRSSPGSKNSIVFLLKRMPPLCARWKRCWTSTYTHMMHGIRRSVWTKQASSWSVRHGCPSQPNWAGRAL